MSQPSRGAVALAAGTFVYTAAVAHRSAFGVAGLTAADRFGLGATTLSLFVVVQVVVYAAMQLPVGVGVDRWGPRATLTVGAALATAGQLGMVLAPDVPAALVARVLVGAGDATAFVTVVRLIPAWFSARQTPVLIQVTGSCGLAGQVVSVLPFAWALHTYGWCVAFGALVVLGAVATAVAWTGVRDRPAGAPAPPRSSLVGLASVIGSPGTWLGFFSHNACCAGVIMFALMWGFPFLVEGQGFCEAHAAAILAVCVATQMVSGPFVGVLSSRMADRRPQLVLVSCVVGLVGWLVLLVPTTPLPVWQLVVGLVAISVGGTVGLIGLELAGHYAPAQHRGSATGIANTGGFVGALVVMFVVGVILDWRSPTPGLADYRVAMVSMPVMSAVATVGVVATWWRVRRAR
ncbi:MAG: MFS transporter [Micrococcales bacterium]|nr:MFS transporter [Micrococcales bacterium]